MSTLKSSQVLSLSPRCPSSLPEEHPDASLDLPTFTGPTHVPPAPPPPRPRSEPRVAWLGGIQRRGRSHAGIRCAASLLQQPQAGLAERRLGPAMSSPQPWRGENCESNGESNTWRFAETQRFAVTFFGPKSSKP